METGSPMKEHQELEFFKGNFLGLWPGTIRSDGFLRIFTYTDYWML